MNRQSSFDEADPRFHIPTENELQDLWAKHERAGVALRALANVLDACQLIHPAEDVQDVPAWLRALLNDFTAGGAVDALRAVTEVQERQERQLRTWTEAREAHLRSRLADRATTKAG